MLLDIVKEKISYAMETIRNLKGVIDVDTLEGHPNIFVIVEASDRQRLFDLMMPVLDSVDHVTENVHLLVNRGNRPASVFDMPHVEINHRQAVN
jgi:hypothetical protein